MKILHLDSNHPILIQQLNALGCINDTDYTSSKLNLLNRIQDYDGIVIRSRFSIDETFIDAATNLKFIARVGAGVENINSDYAQKQGIHLIAAPEGNRNAVAEHTLGMLLCLFNKLNMANSNVKAGKWLREAHRGFELDGHTVGLIGYGHMGKAFAKKLRGFDVEVLCYDIKKDLGDANAKQVSLPELKKETTVLSLHTPQTPLTLNMVNAAFINEFKHPFWLLNTARGKSIVTKDLVAALQGKKILGAGLDVLEYEKSSFENLFSTSQPPEAFQYLIHAENVLLSPHVAGWTMESKERLAKVIVSKIEAIFY